MMSKKRSYLMLAGCLCAALAMGAAKPVSAPNVLFIYLDDLGYGDTTCYNADSKIKTPNIDRIAAEGLRFTDAHTAASICGPSRYGLMSGRYPWRRGKGGRGNGPKFRDLFFEKGCSTVATVLKGAGYNTAQIGKWGIRHNYSDAVKEGKEPGFKDSYDFPNKRLLGSQAVGFDYSWCMTHLFAKNNGKNINQYTKHQMENGLPVDPEMKLSDPYQWLPGSATKVIEYLETYAGERTYAPFGIDNSKPFFIYYDPPAPHEPIIPNDEFKGRSEAGDYGDFVVEIDDWVGKILTTLDETGLTKNTIVVFSSDNGPERICYDRITEFDHYSMGELRGAKRDTWEGGHRVPMIVRWPGVTSAGKTTDALVCMTDWFATFAEMTGQKTAGIGGQDSISLLPVLKGLGPSRRTSIIHHSPTAHFALRKDEWLFIDHRTGDSNVEPDSMKKTRGVVAHSCPGELFNLKDDPQETHNLYETHPEKVSSMKALLDSYKKSDSSIH